MDMPMQPADQAGASVTIDKLPDGTFTVSPNPGKPQPAGSIDEALEMARGLLDGGEASPEGLEMLSREETPFQRGYAKQSHGRPGM